MHIDQKMCSNTIMIGHTNSKLVKTDKNTITTPTKNTDITFDMPNEQVMVNCFFKLSEYHVVSE
jgi:hypothetical protein